MPDERPHKSKAALDKLTPAEQQAIFERVESGTLAEAAKYIAAEYDLRLSIEAISKWAMAQRFKKNLAARVGVIVRARVSADQLMQQVGDATSIDKANLILLGQAFMDAQLAASDPENPKEISAVVIKELGSAYSTFIDAMAKSRRADAAVQDSETARRKFEFDAARAVLKHADEINAIRQSTATNAEKEQLLVERMFGNPPEITK